MLILGMILGGAAVSGQTSTPTGIPDGMMPDLTNFGRVTSIEDDGSAFTISTDGQNEATVNVDQNTSYIIIFMPIETLNSLSDTLEGFLGEGSPGSLQGLPGIIGGTGTAIQLARFEDIEIGDIVTYDTASPEDTVSEVIMIRFLDMLRVRGTITAVNADSITITPAEGDAVTVNWDDETRFLMHRLISVETGQIANAIYNETTNRAVIVVIRTSSLSPSATPTAVPMTPATP
jgi:hypothetical protein